MGKSKDKQKPVTVQTRRWQDKLESITVNVISFLVFIAFGFIAIMGIFQVSVIDPDKYINEHILYQSENLLISLPLTVLFFFLILFLRKKYDFFNRVDMRFMEYGLVAYVLVLGLLWVINVQCKPAADSANIFEAASGAAQGDYTGLTSNDQFYNHSYYGDYSYFMYVPYQLGFVFICEIIYRIFGASTAMPLEIINVICLASAYLCIAKITKLLFRRRSIEFAAIVLMAACFQPILFTPFPYGNIIGMTLSLWAGYFLIKYLQGARWTMLIPAGALLTLAVVVKYNSMIYLVAFAIVLLIHAIKEKKWQGIAFVLAAAICAVGAGKLIVMSYEARSGQEYPSGMSQMLFLDVGMQESYMAPGWYTSIGVKTYRESGFDAEKANKKAMSDISLRLNTFTYDIDYAADFFSKKILSQWNEPTFESIWVSKVKSHYNGDPTGIVDSVYNKGFSKIFDFWFNIYMQMLYILFAFGTFVMMAKGKMNLARVLLPLVLLGAFGYHLLFEAKSQYILTYIILMIPSAAWGAVTLMESKLNFFMRPAKKDAKVQ